MRNIAFPNLLKTLREYVLMTAGLLIYSFGWIACIKPMEVAAGGGTGLAMIVSHTAAEMWGVDIRIGTVFLTINAFLLLLSGLTARAGLPASFKERLAEASRENRTIQCDFTQRKQVRRMKNEIELKGRFYYDNSLAMALDYTVPEGDKVIIRNDRIILKTAGQVTQTATSANPMLQQVALMIRASMTGDLSQFGQGWQIGYTEKEGVGEVKMVPESKRARKYIDSITLCFDLKDMTLDRMELCETQGGRSVYEFRNKRFNLPVDPARFNP